MSTRLNSPTSSSSLQSMEKDPLFDVSQESRPSKAWVSSRESNVRSVPSLQPSSLYPKWKPRSLHLGFSSTTVGLGLGTGVAQPVGCVWGDWSGLEAGLGPGVGSAVSPLVGPGIGPGVGARVGCSVRPLEGLGEGEGVGALVGPGVGVMAVDGACDGTRVGLGDNGGVGPGPGIGVSQ